MTDLFLKTNEPETDNDDIEDPAGDNEENAENENEFSDDGIEDDEDELE